MIGYIYLTVNKLNGKRYIGRRKSEVFLGNAYLGSGVHLKRSITKYGKENFDVTLLEEVQGTYDDLIDREAYYIKLYDAVNRDDFYNESYGGPNEGFIKGSGNIASTERARKLNSEKHKGLRHTEEQNKAMSNYWKVHGHPKGFQGHKHTDSAKAKISEVSKRQVHTKERDSLVSNHHKGSKFMSKDGVQKWVYQEDIQDYLNDGWVFGSCKPRKPRTKKNI